MTGGMHGRRGLTLAERSALPGSTAHLGPAPPGPASGSPGPAGPPARPPADTEPARAASRPVSRHCWVIDLPGLGGRWPGVLLEWRCGPDGRWSGRAAYAVLDDDRTVLVEGWVAAEHLEPA